MNALELLRSLWPLVLLQLGLTVAGLWDLSRRRRVRGLPKAAWAVIIIGVATIGPILYFTLGRAEE